MDLMKNHLLLMRKWVEHKLLWLMALTPVLSFKKCFPQGSILGPLGFTVS